MKDYNIIDNIVDIPMIPLRGLVVFPNMSLHFDVGRKKSVNALNTAMKNGQRIFLVSQKDASCDDPKIDDLYEIGVVCEIKQMIKIPNSSNLKVVVEGIDRGCIKELNKLSPYISCSVDVIEKDNSVDKSDVDAYMRAIKSEFEKYASMLTKLSNEVISKVISIDDPDEFSDFVCSNTFIDYADKQTILETVHVLPRLKKLLVLLKKEISTLEIEAEIQRKVKSEIDKDQREYYLREEMKVIADALGENGSTNSDYDKYSQKIKELDCSDEIKNKLQLECDKLAKMPSGSHEISVITNYLDKCLMIPFGKYTDTNVDLVNAKDTLDKDHYGLDEVKTRILESLAVLKRNPNYAGQIICLYGPPGVGKTSIVKSLAKAMNRKYVRIALGGVNDEAEIRGHRKTYIGAMPGRIIDSIIKSGSMNPIVLLDEIDKISRDYKGDPASALLEALDPEQNNTFEDHYIDFPVDLSKVLFITTANDTSTISRPLYDRMEVIELNSYTEEEKFNIAKKHLVKKEMKKHNLASKEFKITDKAIYKIIECYTSEAGVRGLEKQIAKLCRKALVKLESDGVKSVNINNRNLSDFLGVEKYQQDTISTTNQIGTVNGLAWTSVGGTMLPIEVAVIAGSGKIELTGNLGDVMKESAKTAISFVRSQADKYGIDPYFYKEKDIHIHAPEGAIPKDGPSAGLAITTAVLSELTQIPIKSNVAMTGEISLKGKAMAIGGLKEKSMAAYKAGCDTVIIPKENEKDLSEISDEVKKNINFITVTKFDEVVNIALERCPKRLKKSLKENKNIIIDSQQPDTDICVAQ